MGKKATKKFAARGQLKKTIEARHKAKQIKKKFNSRKPRERVVPEHESDAGEAKKPSKRCVNKFLL